MNSRALASTGSVLSALAASACCWLPLLLAGVGLSAVGIGGFLERFRPLLLIVAAALLGLGFYLNYFRKERCAPDGSCAPPPPRLRRMNRISLWVSTALVLAFALFPSYADELFDLRPTTAPANASIKVGKLNFLGAACPGCGVAVNQSLAGHWISEFQDQDGGTIELTMDLGLAHSHWVGEFDLPKYKVKDYPVEVKAVGDTIRLYFTAIGVSFQGTLAANGQLEGTARSRTGGNEPISFKNKGTAQFSDGFLALQAAADDSSLVETLAGDGRQLKERFNADREKTRLLLLLSPT